MGAHSLIFWDGIGTIDIPVSLNHWGMRNQFYVIWSSRWLDKSTHLWEKTLSICFLWSCKNQTHTKYKGVWKKTHMLVKIQTCVWFSIKVGLLFLFAIVLEFLIFDMILYLYLSFQTRTCNIRRLKHLENIIEKKLLENSHTCEGRTTHKKTAIRTSKQINFTCVHPLDLRILKRLLFQVFIEPFQK